MHIILLYTSIVFGVLYASVGTEDMSRSRLTYRRRASSCVWWTYLYYMDTPSNKYTYKYVIWDPRSDCDQNNIEPESLP